MDKREDQQELFEDAIQQAFKMAQQWAEAFRKMSETVGTDATESAQASNVADTGAQPHPDPQHPPGATGTAAASATSAEPPRENEARLKAIEARLAAIEARLTALEQR
jgi:hypothetical protein